MGGDDSGAYPGLEQYESDQLSSIQQRDGKLDGESGELGIRRIVQ